MSDNQNLGLNFNVSNDINSSFLANPLPDAFGIVKTKLQQAANNSALFYQVFGDKANTPEIQAVRTQWAIGDFSQLPQIQTLSAANMNGADGAYASSTQKIYLSDALFQSNLATGVLVEETFHWLDDRVGTDTKGDEGELARVLVLGESVSNAELARIKQEDDRGFIIAEGQSVFVEKSGSSVTIESQGNGKLIKSANNLLSAQIGSNTAIAIKYNGAQIYTSIFAGWETVAVENIGGQNQLLWKNASTNSISLWNLDSNWNFLSSVGVLALNSGSTLIQETNFGLDLNGDSVIGSVNLEWQGNTKLVKDAANLLYAQVGSNTPIAVKYNGSQIYTSIFAGWETVAVENIGGQNQLLWKSAVTNSISLWNLDSNWNFLSSAGVIPLNSGSALAQGTNFGIDLNSNNYIGATPVSIESQGSTKLVKDGAKLLYAQIGNNTPIAIKYNGAQIYTNIFAGWETVAVENIGGQNQLLWKNASTNSISLWNLDSNWNFLSSAGVIPLNSGSTLIQETNFSLDLNGDSVIGSVNLEWQGNTKLVKDAANLLYAQVDGNIPISIKYNGAQIYTTIFAGWETVAVENIGGQNQLLWKSASTNSISVWNLDSNWNFLSSAGVIALNSGSTLIQETNFGLDLNGDSVVGPVNLELQGNTKLVKDAANLLYAQVGGNTPISINYNGSQIYTTIFAGWETVAVENIGGQNQLLWKSASTNSISLWNLDSNWNFLSSAGVIPLNSGSTLIQETNFGLDLNGDGFVGQSVSVVTVSVTDNVSAETISGQAINNGTFTLTRTVTNAAIAVNYTLSGTAANGTDYITLSGVANFAVGAATAIVTVSPIDDALFEGDETVILTLASGSGYTLGALNTSTITINDNDLPTITIAANDASAGEVASGQTQNSGQLVINRTGSTNQPLTVSYSVGGSATLGNDYRLQVGNTVLNGTIEFAAGESSKVLDIIIVDDSIEEISETIEISLLSNTNYSLGSSQSISLFIIDNEIIAPNDAPELPSGGGGQESPVSPSSDYQINALLGGAKWDTPVVTYSFLSSASAPTYYGSEKVSEVSNEFKSAIRSIIEGVIEPLINLDFQEVADSQSSFGKIRYMLSNGPNYAWAYSPSNYWDIGGDVHFNPSYQNANNTSGFLSGLGSHGYVAIIHETLHALGLKHPGDYNGDGKGEPPFLPQAEDHTGNTAMSYYFPSNPLGVGDSSRAVSLMPYDLKALNYIYGVKPLNSSNTTYVFDQVDRYAVNGQASHTSNSTVKQTLWDTGGIDNLDFSSLSFDGSGYRLDLNQGQVLTTKLAYNNGQNYYYDSKLKQSYYNVTSAYGTWIAYGAVIENLINSTSNDEIFANSAANTFRGYQPNKNTGDDIYWNTDSSDTLDLSGYNSANVTRVRTGNDEIIGLGTSGSITIKNYYLGSKMQILLGDPLPSLSISDITIAEGNSGTSNGVFTVTRTGTTTQAITVNYATSNNSATAGSDYTGTSGSLTFATNETSKTIIVPIIGDTTIEGNETFFVNLSNAVNATIADSQGLGTITNDDLPTLAINDVTIVEGNSGTSNAVFTVNRTGTATQAITVNYATANNTATAGSDYTGTSGTLTFATNETSKTIIVPMIGDTAVEGNETFFVNLSNAVNATIADSQGLGTITNDDVAPVSFVTVTSPNGGESLQAGSSYNITWSDNISENVKVDLFKGGIFNQTIFSSTLSDGSESWTVPTNLATGSEYQIKISSVNNTSLADLSNSNFTVIPVPTSWVKRISSASSDSLGGIAIDSNGSINVSGNGSSGVFLAKFDVSGSNTWLEQSISGYATGIATNGDSIYTSGYTDIIDSDASISKYSAERTLLWNQNLGDAISSEFATAITTDSSGNVYISGLTYGNLGGTNVGGSDAFVTKYNTSGTLLWAKQLGTTANDNASGISTDSSGNVYITGSTNGNLAGTNAGGSDAFVAKYNTAGTLLWAKQLGTTANDSANGIATDSSGNLYITGSTSGSLGGTNAGGSDAFVAKYNTSGTLLWTTQLGTTAADRANSIATDITGNVYITGSTSGNLGGTNAGGSDAFAVKYDAAGTLIWNQHFGDIANDYGEDIAVDSNGNVYIAGTTDGAIIPSLPNQGGSDVFLYKISQGIDGANTVTVNSPNGGESLQAGSSYNITWSDNISENVKVDLFKGGVFAQTIFSSTLSDGSETWTVPTNLVAGSDYQIKVSSVSNNKVFDFGHSYFTISNIPTITISATDPNASETTTGQSANNGQFTLVRSGDLTSALTVNYSITGTATNGVDYNTLSQSVTFAAGSSTANVSVIPEDQFRTDFAFEGIETVVLTLSSGAGYVIGSSNAATVTIQDNETDTVSNAMTGATSVGGGTQSFADFIDVNDEDWYLIPLTSATASAITFTFSLNNLSHDALVELRNSNGTVLSSTGLSFPSGSIYPSTQSAPSRTVTLAGGSNYYLRVTSTSIWGTAYNLVTTRPGIIAGG